MDRLDTQLGTGRQFQRGVLHHQGDLEQRRPDGLPLRLKQLDQFVKGQLLVSVRPHHAFVYPADHFAERRIAAQIGPQCQRVDEESDHLFQLFVGPVGRDRAYGNVLLPAVAAQQHLEARHQDHEERGPILPGELGNPSGETRGPLERAGRPVKRR